MLEVQKKPGVSSFLDFQGAWYAQRKVGSSWEAREAGKLLANGSEAAVLPVASLRAPLQAF